MKQIWIACFLRDVGRGYGHVARWTLRVRTKTQKVFHKITLQCWQKYLINMWLSPSKVGSWLRVSVLSPRATPARRRQHITRFRFRTSAHVLGPPPSFSVLLSILAFLPFHVLQSAVPWCCRALEICCHIASVKSYVTAVLCWCSAIVILLN